MSRQQALLWSLLLRLDMRPWPSCCWNMLLMYMSKTAAVALPWCWPVLLRNTWRRRATRLWPSCSWSMVLDESGGCQIRPSIACWQRPNDLHHPRLQWLPCEKSWGSIWLIAVVDRDAPLAASWRGEVPACMTVYSWASECNISLWRKALCLSRLSRDFYLISRTWKKNSRYRRWVRDLLFANFLELLSYEQESDLHYQD